MFSIQKMTLMINSYSYLCYLLSSLYMQHSENDFQILKFLSYLYLLYLFHIRHFRDGASFLFYFYPLICIFCLLFLARDHKANTRYQLNVSFIISFSKVQYILLYIHLRYSVIKNLFYFLYSFITFNHNFFLIILFYSELIILCTIYDLRMILYNC